LGGGTPSSGGALVGFFRHPPAFTEITGFGVAEGEAPMFFSSERVLFFFRSDVSRSSFRFAPLLATASPQSSLLLLHSTASPHSSSSRAFIFRQRNLAVTTSSPLPSVSQSRLFSLLIIRVIMHVLFMRVMLRAYIVTNRR
jgi:hypothetical protein